MSKGQDGAEKYVAVHVDDIPNIPYEWAPETEWKPVRRYFGIGSFGANLFRATKAGDVLTEDHTEDPESGTRHEELYVVLAGHATFKVDGTVFEAPARTFVYVPDPKSVRGAVAREGGTILLAVGAEPGVAFSPSEWDTGALPG